MNTIHFGPHQPQADEREVLVPPNLLTKTDLLAYLARAVPLPEYFGHNWDALEESLGDLPSEPKVILVHQDLPLAHSSAEQRTYLQILTAAIQEGDGLAVVFPTDCRDEITRQLKA